MRCNRAASIRISLLTGRPGRAGNNDLTRTKERGPAKPAGPLLGFERDYLIPSALLSGCLGAGTCQAAAGALVRTGGAAGAATSVCGAVAGSLDESGAASRRWFS